MNLLSEDSRPSWGTLIVAPGAFDNGYFILDDHTPVVVLNSGASKTSLSFYESGRAYTRIETPDLGVYGDVTVRRWNIHIAVRRMVLGEILKPRVCPA